MSLIHELKNQNSLINPKLPEQYNPPFIEVLKRKGFFYISRESFEQQDIICNAIKKQFLESFLTDNNFEVSKFSKEQYKIFKAC